LNRIAYIDGLRAVAVASVVAFHAAKYNPAIAGDPSSLLGLALRHGSHGVDLFFVLSGFCLSYPTLQRLYGGDAVTFDVARFAARRIVRITGPYYCTIVVLLVLVFGLRAAGLGLPPSMPQSGFSAGDVVLQALFFDHNVRFLNGSFWTLAVEFRWYFVFPLVLWLWTVSPRAFALVAIVALVAYTSGARLVDFLTLPAFMLGIVAAAVAVRRPPAARWALPALLGLVALGVATSGSDVAPWVWTTTPVWQLAAFALVVAAGATPQLSRLLEVRALTAVGAASYGIYLVHEPVIAFVERHAPPAGAPLALAAMLSGIAVGLAFSRVAERPFVSSPLRDRMVGALERTLSRRLQALRIARGVPLRRAALAVAKQLVERREVVDAGRPG
jgi:peptidoglycan/LPS O-acetylase OafA/YrhL